MASKLTPRQRLDRVHVSLLRDERTLVMGGILMMGRSEVTTMPAIVPTACTNGLNKFYDETYMGTLDDDELRSLVVHENLHVMYKHLTVWEHLFKQDQQRANIATDFVVNAMIQKMDPQGTFLKPIMGKPPGLWLYDKRFENMDVGEVYRLLPKMFGGGGGKGKGGSGGGNEAMPDSGLDVHNWEEAQEMSAEAREELSKQIDQAIRQGIIAVGKVTGKRDRTFDGLLEPKVDWRKVLRDFITQHCDGRDESTWRRPNRRWLQYDTYLPSMHGISTGDLVIGIDTSGSIGGEMLNKFMAEVKGICEGVQPAKLHILYWDSSVAGHETYTREQMAGVISSTKPKGGGGTAPSCVTQYMDKHKIKPLATVMLTDGHVGDDWGGHWQSPVLWVIIGNKGAHPSAGVVVHAED